MLPASARQLYARHLLLAEIGEAGQTRLCAARVALPQRMDPRVAQVARDYLERAGLCVDAGSVEHEAGALLGQTAQLCALAGDASLEPAAGALLGALAAVEAIKAALQLGSPLQLQAGLSLCAEHLL